MEPDTTSKTRDAERSKHAILEAATQLFARKGFDATSVGEIAQAAGVARGTPAYFFGSKENLFGSVMDRLNRRSLEIVPNALARAGARPSAKKLIGVFVDAYLDFHDANPEFLRLIHWIDMGGDRLSTQSASHWEALAAMLSAVVMTFKGTALEHNDPRQMVLSIIGLCNAHLTYGQTVAGPLGLQIQDPQFLEARKTHLKQVLVAAMQKQTKGERQRTKI